MKRIAVAVALLVSLAGPAWAGVDEGLAAYNRGDYETALREFKPLAEQGHPRAQWALGFMYYNGEGVPQNHAEAAKWLRRVAEQGFSPPQVKLGFMYWWGEGVPQDYVQAHLWFTIAEALGWSHARGLSEKVAKEMTPAQIAEAQRLAREWRPKKE